MPKPNPFATQSSDAVKKWDLPFVESTKTEEEEKRTNALNRRSDWKYEPPEEVEEEEIKPPTAEEIEAIRQAAYDEGHQEGKQIGFDEGKSEGLEAGQKQGYDEGFAAGENEGLESGKQQIDAQANAWQQLIEQLNSPLGQVNEDVRKQLVNLALTLARSVIRTEIKTNDDVIFQALSEGLKALPINEKQYQLQMHPDDIARVKSHYSDEEITSKNWQLVESPSMQPGGCEIITTQNAVDVSIDRRVRDVIEKFMFEQGINSE
ncbi:flagellar assembly protein FliH [Alteromonas sp. ASW11-130]|uniref:flagellar assembly protein FliH n=1 Tax=Alteromonas sp. ASW11-130 TaxID=3015775 RepID=UPI00224266D9|nr:flagellar assembly protein FliH [Alteromonas sp. ASW11-130]MCW8090360.1 flagellar assembly protein FliH [Alteromonas sp. ASW11-130]